MEVPLYEQLYNHVLEEIRAGHLKSGERVPSEKELAEQFGVSRITSKKALEKLDQAGIIERARGKGSFVAENLPELSQLTPFSREKTPVVASNGAETGKLIGVVLPDFSNAFGLKLLYSIEERCSEHQCMLVMKRSHGRREEEEEAIRTFVEMGVDGLIVFPVHGEYYNAELLRLVLNKFPLVLVDRHLKGIPACALYTDNDKAAYQLTKYLLEQGHQNIAFLSPPPENTSTIEERLQGYKTALTDYNLPINPDYLFTGILSTLPGAFQKENIVADQEKLRLFLEQRPEVTAFVACEYNIALILAQLLESLDKKIPEDYALVCFDSPEDPFGAPRFTHVQQDETAMGRMAVNMLVKQLQGHNVPLHTVVDFRLIEGKSTAQAISKSPENLANTY